MISASLHRHRLAIVRLCCCALLLLGVGAQLHVLAHALQAAQAAAHHGAAAAHAQACEQCVQYSVLDAAVPVADVAGTQPGSATVARAEPRAPLVTATFVAYRSRAPPSAV